MRQELGELTIATRGRALLEITADVARWLRGVQAKRGLLTLLLRHTSASLLIQENADPAVLRDLETFLGELVPDGDPRFVHTEEGPDDTIPFVVGEQARSGDESLAAARLEG